MNEFENFIEVNNDIELNNWIKIEHGLLPTKPKWLRDLIRRIMALLGHCLICTSLDNCYFVNSKSPSIPIHTKCHCYNKKIESKIVKSQAVAECPIEKFTNYIFASDEKSKGKKQMFESWGYTIRDSQYLAKKFEKQAYQKYTSGNYSLNGLDENGQRITCLITLKNETFKSGWMVEPEGKIRNITPFGGWVK